MARTRRSWKVRAKARSRAWTWRWRRNPLRRRSDRMEAWIVLATWVFVLLAGVVAGRTAAAAADHAVAVRNAHAHPVQAVQVEDAARAPQGVPEYSDGSVWAKVSWTVAGVTHTGLTKVEPGQRAGTAVTVWTSRGGELVARPVGDDQARVQARLVGSLVGACAAGGMLVCGLFARGRLDRRRMEEWDREWESVGPRWRRTIG
ncbi:Rv1733c family protein [Streptomyces lannensis]